MSQANKELYELGRVRNGTSYTTRFWDPDHTAHIHTQSMLVARHGFAKGDYVLAKVRMMRSTRQIISLDAVPNPSMPVQLQLTSTLDASGFRGLMQSFDLDDKGIRKQLVEIRDYFINSSMVSGSQIIDRMIKANSNWVFEQLSKLPDAPDTLERYTFPVDFGIETTMIDAAIFCDAFNNMFAHSNSIYMNFQPHGVTTSATSAPKKTSEPDTTLFEWVNGIWVQENMRSIFRIANNTMEFGEHLNVLLTGPSGYGKTTFFSALAHWLGVELIYVNCANVTDNQAWFGTHEARDGSTIFQLTDFAEAVQRGNCVIVLDEANRLEPWLTNSLMPILDHRRATEVHKHQIKAGPGIIFGLTMNIGSRYAGVSVVDAAFRNRMDIVAEVEAPPPSIEIKLLESRFGFAGTVLPEPPSKTAGERVEVRGTDINQIVAIVGELRNYIERNELDIDVSTRTSNKLAKLMSLGATLLEALHYVVVFAAEFDVRKGILDIISNRLK